MKMPASIRYFGVQFLALLRYPPVLINYLLHDNEKFPHQLGIAAIMKNEAPYLKEWIEYHRLVGVEKFYLFDNESSDNTKEVLEPYIQSGEVEHIYFPGVGVKNQIRCYSEAVRRFRNKVKWLAVIDIDEFIVPATKSKIIEVINNIERELWRKRRKKLFGFAVRWVPYGYDRHYKRPDGLVIENFRKHGDPIMLSKSIFNPRAAIHAAPSAVHTPVYLDLSFGVTECGENNPWKAPVSINEIRINHYVTKSYEEYTQKMLRNKTGFPETRNILPDYDPDYLSEYEDPIMDRYAVPLKQIVGLGGN
jgi:hypothetical protein